MTKEKIAFIVVRYGKDINGGAEYHCRMLAERLVNDYDVEVLTTCVKNYVTGDNEYPEGEEILNGVLVRRFYSDPVEPDLHKSYVRQAAPAKKWRHFLYRCRLLKPLSYVKPIWHYKEQEEIKNRLEQAQTAINQKGEELQKMLLKEREKLEELSGLSAEEAKTYLIESLKDEAKSDAQSYINEIIDDAKMTANKEAKKIVIQTIQRVATETAIENSVTVFHIDNDEVKGRIIGREGRNIRALEAATGVELVVDDTPESIVISAFDPVRREICRLALHQLITDGRIHPARIEEVVAKVKKQVEEEIIETGKRTTIDLGVHGLHPELVRLIGKMKYRSSYGQNLLQHARETANLCAIMASELGLNPKKAKRAGLLHDIGKVPDEEPEMPHALYGAKLAEQYKEKADICNAIGAHHDEVEMNTLLAPIVQVCDAISGARPGARREVVEAYIKRLNDLENIAMSYPGVTKTYAIQAGRELRVIVGADKIDDKQTENLSNEIAKRIQDEMTYPGQVKITVIRETRSVSYAK